MAVDGIDFRESCMYRKEVNTILHKNQEVVHKLFKHFSGPDKQYLQYEDIKQLINEANMHMNL